jgi:hypothetical protein
VVSAYRFSLTHAAKESWQGLVRARAQARHQAISPLFGSPRCARSQEIIARIVAILEQQSMEAQQNCLMIICKNDLVNGRNIPAQSKMA